LDYQRQAHQVASIGNLYEQQSNLKQPNYQQQQPGTEVYPMGLSENQHSML
jgi:hypothetical protein